MLNYAIFHKSFIAFFILSFVVMFVLMIFKIKAPYGKLTNQSWGKLWIPSCLGWIIMESPSVFIFFIFYFFSSHKNLENTLLLFIWQFHYFFRSFIYPIFTKHSKKMSLGMLLSAFSFQMFNTYFQAAWIYFYAPKHLYDNGYLVSAPFLIGLGIFLFGSILNRWSDHILSQLRKNKEDKSYKIPFGGFYRWVSCPNYLGEILIWLGWATLLQSWIGLSFFVWTVANLAPRAFQVHQWYRDNFPEYPQKRKSLIPYII